MSRVKILAIFAVGTFDLTVMARRIRTNQLVSDATLFELQLKQRGSVVIRGKSVGKFGAVVGLDTLGLEMKSFQHVF